MGKKKKKRKVKLIYTMSGMIAICWLLPLMIFTYVLLFMMTGKISTQIENTIVTSTDKAIEICVMQLDDVVTASQNASYITTIRDSYLEYRQTGSEQDLYNDVNLFLTQQYKYIQNISSTMLYFVDNPEEIYYTHGISNAANQIGIRDFQKNYQGIITEAMKKGDTGVKMLCIEDRIFMVRNLVTSSFETFAVLCI